MCVHRHSLLKPSNFHHIFYVNPIIHSILPFQNFSKSFGIYSVQKNFLYMNSSTLAYMVEYDVSPVMGHD
jgi:hypothetical protein